MKMQKFNVIVVAILYILCRTCVCMFLCWVFCSKRIFINDILGRGKIGVFMISNSWFNVSKINFISIAITEKISRKLRFFFKQN